MTRFELVIVGGGLTAARAIASYRAAGGSGRIALLTRERELPYHRPPLSKRYLRGEAERHDTLVEPPGFYDDNGVELELGREVVELDPHERAVATKSGERYGFEKLLLATGSVPRRLDVDGADGRGVFTLRALDDAAAIRERAAEVRDAVVVGSGFVGMEVAASLTEIGLDVTLVSREVDLFAQLRSPEVSEHLVRLYRGHGVEIVRGDEVRAFRGRPWLDTVELHTGRPVAAGLAVVGIGVVPAVAFLERSGLTLDDGVVVDEGFETSLPSVYAAGDIARFFDPLHGRSRRIEHWSNADYQGRLVGRILAGEDDRYDTVSTFFTESFGLALKVFGDPSRHDDRVSRGSFEDGDAIVFYLERGRLVGTLHTGQSQETEEALTRLIAARAEIADAALLADGEIPVGDVRTAAAATPIA